VKLLTSCLLSFVIALQIVAAQEQISTAPAIEGIVFDEDTKDPVSGARVRAFEVDYDLNGARRLAFVPNAADLTDNPFTDRPFNPESAPVSADGSFTIRDVAEEEHQLMEILGLPEYGYIQEATLDGADALHSWMTAQSSSSFLDITVDAKGGEVSGHLTDGIDRLYGDSATVVLVPIRPLGALNRASAKTATIESGGTFRITGIRPGEYRLLAWHKLKGTAYLNAEFMSHYERRGTLVKVERNSRITAAAPVVDAR